MYPHLVQAFQNTVSGYLIHFTTSSHLVSKTLNIVTMQRQTEKIRVLEKSHMSACYPEMFIDHESDQSSTKESVIFVSLLLFLIDPLSEVRIWNALPQGSSDLRNKRLNRFPKIDRDVSRSSTKVAISTSCIQRSASKG